MAEVFGRKNRKIPVSQDDIDKVAKAINLKLKEQNKQLSSEISNKEESLKSLNKQVELEQKNLNSIAKAIPVAQSDMKDAQEKAKVEQDKVSLLKAQVSNAVDSEKKIKLSMNTIENSKEKLQQQSDELKQSINDDNQVVSFMKIELEELNDKKDKGSLELIQILAEIKQAKQDKVSEDKLLQNNKEKSESTIEALNSKILLVNDDIEVAEKSYDASKLKLKDLDSAIADKEKQFNDISALVKDKELAQLALEVQHKKALSEIDVAKNKADQEVECAKHEKQKIQAKFKDWKITALNDIARLKIKGKLDVIDKAGLSEILNG
jgi:chromosome segregation ATPase